MNSEGKIVLILLSYSERQSAKCEHRSISNAKNNGISFDSYVYYITSITSGHYLFRQDRLLWACCTPPRTHLWNLSHFQSLFVSYSLERRGLLQALPKVAWQMPMSPTVTNMSHSECLFLSPDRAALTSQRGRMHKLNHASRSSPSLISLSSSLSISPHLFICYLFYFSSLTAL